MEEFGPSWSNHLEKIKEGWKDIGSSDITIIAGDISWANNLDGAKPDLDFIEQLPGKKVITCGNHDYFNQTATKSDNFFFNHYKTMVMLNRNDYINLFDEIAICGVKGYMNENHPEFKEEYRKSYDKECARLERTLMMIPSFFKTRILVSHYPPIHNLYLQGNNKFLNILERYNVNICIYGHLHGPSASGAFVGMSGNINFMFVAGDNFNFKPLFVMDLGD